MKNYSYPEIKILDAMEGVYAASGTPGITTTPTPQIEEPPFNYNLQFADLNCGGYSTVQFLANGCVNTHKYRRLILTINFFEGVKCNKLDTQGYMLHPEVLGWSGAVERYAIQACGNAVKVFLDLRKMNMTETIEFKFGTKFHHSDSHNKNGNSYYGAYNGFTNETMSSADKEVRRWSLVSLETVAR